MASAELQRLWKLSRIDNGLVEIRQRAAALDPGKRILSEIDALKKQEAEVGGHARKLAADLADLELAQKGIADKLKKIDRELYGGTIVNPREVENFEKEIVILKRHRDTNDEKILELWDTLPPAKEAAAKIDAQIADKQAQLVERKKAALAQKATLEAEFARLTKMRPDATRGITPALMERYDGIRQRNGGIGMTEVTKKQTCAQCGTVLPERTVQGLKDEKAISCESCHSILYYTEGLL